MTALVSRQATSRDLAPATIEQARTDIEIQLYIAKELCKSDLLPKEYRDNPANTLVAINLGRSLGLEPMQAIYGCHVIEGRPTPSAKLQASLARRAGHKVRQVGSTDTEATCEIVRQDDPDYAFRVTYTIDDARTAGALDVRAVVWKKTQNGKSYPEEWAFPESLPATATVDEMVAAGCPETIARDRMVKISKQDAWHKRPRVMLWHRAITECVGIACPEVVAGIELEQGWYASGEVVDVGVVGDPVDVLMAQPADDEEIGVVLLEEAEAAGEIVIPEMAVEEPDIEEAEIVIEPADQVFYTAPPKVDPPPIPQTAPATATPAPATGKTELMSAAAFKAHVRTCPGWTTPLLLKAMAAAGSSCSIDEIVTDPDLYSHALDLLETTPAA